MSVTLDHWAIFFKSLVIWINFAGFLNDEFHLFSLDKLINTGSAFVSIQSKATGEDHHRFKGEQVPFSDSMRLKWENISELVYHFLYQLLELSTSNYFVTLVNCSSPNNVMHFQE